MSREFQFLDRRWNKKKILWIWYECKILKRKIDENNESWIIGFITRPGKGMVSFLRQCYSRKYKTRQNRNCFVRTGISSRSYNSKGILARWNSELRQRNVSTRIVTFPVFPGRINKAVPTRVIFRQERRFIGIVKGFLFFFK